jgi:hypothetical protein
MSKNMKKKLLRQLAREAGMTEQEILDEFGESAGAVFAKPPETIKREISEFFCLRAKTDTRKNQLAANRLVIRRDSPVSF